MGLIVDALKQLVEQGDLDIDRPKEPAVTSIRLTKKNSLASEQPTELNSQLAQTRPNRGIENSASGLLGNQTVVVESSASPSTVEVVETESVDSTELSNFESYDSLLSDVDERLDSIEQSLDASEPSESPPSGIAAASEINSAVAPRTVAPAPTAFDSSPTPELAPDAGTTNAGQLQAAPELSDEQPSALGSQPSDAPPQESPASPAETLSPAETFEEELPEVPETDSNPAKEVLSDHVDALLDGIVEQDGNELPHAPGSSTPSLSAAINFDEPDDDDIDVVEPDEVNVEALFEAAEKSESPYQPVVGAWAEVAANEEGEDNELVSDEFVSDEHDDEAEDVCQTMKVDDGTLSTFSEDYLPRSSNEETPEGEHSGNVESSQEIEVTHAPVEAAPLAVMPKLPPTEFDKKIQTLLADSRRRKPFEQLRDGIDHLVSKGATKSILILTVDTPNRSADVNSTLASLYGETVVEPILLIDGAFPGRTISERFGADGEGLIEVAKSVNSSDVNSRDNDEWESVLRLTDQEGMHLLPAGGGVVANGSELVDRHDELSSLFEIWKHRYGRIVVDGGSTDSPIAGTLSRACDATFLLVELGQDSSDAARQSVESLQQAGGRVLGCIVDDMGADS